MPVPASINDLSTTASSNSPPGSESPATIDDYLRAHASFIARLRDDLSNAALSKGANKIINGKMEFPQRGTSFPAANGYTLDRWVVALGGSGVATVTQQADAPPSNEFRNSLRVAVTTADTIIAATDFALVLQRIEGFSARDLIGKTFTFSFWVRSPKAGVHCVAFRNATPDRSYVMEYTVNVANAWEYKTVTVVGGLITAGSWDWTNGIGVDAVFVLAAGSNFQTTANQWQTGNFIATANQVNCLDTVGNIFAVTGVQLEVGPVATPFEHRPYGIEQSLCQRYYAVVPCYSTGQAANGGAKHGVPVYWPVAMRASPSVTGVGAITPLNVTSDNFYNPSTLGVKYEITSAAAGAFYIDGRLAIADSEL